MEKEIWFWFESMENASKSGRPKSASCDEILYQKYKKLLKEMLGIQYMI